MDWLLTFKILSISIAASAACPAGYVATPGGTGCSFARYDAYSYADASAKCAEAGGQPIAVETQQEWQGLVGYFQNYNGYKEMVNSRCGGGFWISLERLNVNDCNSGYGWRKGFPTNSSTYLDPAPYKNFAAGKPVCTAGTNSCFYMSADLGYQWTDSDCSATKCYICEPK